MQHLRSIPQPTLVAALSLGFWCASGCGGSSVPTEAAKPIGVVNPDPKNANAGVTLENESQHMKRLKAEAAKSEAKSTKVAPPR